MSSLKKEDVMKKRMKKFNWNSLSNRDLFYTDITKKDVLDLVSQEIKEDLESWLDSAGVGYEYIYGNFKVICIV